MKKRIINEIGTEIKIYDIIERENSIFVVIDSDKEYSQIFDKKIKESMPDKIIQEVNTNGAALTLEDIQHLYDIGEKRMCKNHINGKQGTGFFLEIKNYSDLPFTKVLFTNNHFIPKKTIVDKSNIKINFINKEKSNISKYLDIEEIEFYDLDYFDGISSNKRRKIFTNKNLDYTCIEILDSDKLNNDFFKNNTKELNKEYIKDKKDIFILQYPSGNDLSYSYGQITEIDNPLIYHNASTNCGSSGSPIICKDNFEVIGIHFGGKEKNNVNYANNISNVLIDVKNKYSYIKSVKDMIKDLKKEKLINNKKYSYSNIKVIQKGKIGNISQGNIQQNDNLVLIININLFQFYKDNNSVNELKGIINNIKSTNKIIYDIYIKEESIYFVIERYPGTIDSKYLNVHSIINIIDQLNNYLKYFRNKNISLNYISHYNILYKIDYINPIGAHIYQFLFYYNKIILGELPSLSAPELINDNDDSKSDLWSIGILLYYLLMKGECPFNEIDNYDEIEKKINNGIIQDNLSFLKNNDFSDLIIKLLKYKKEERIEWNDYFDYFNDSHRIFRALRSPNLIKQVNEIILTLKVDKKEACFF